MGMLANGVGESERQFLNAARDPAAALPGEMQEFKRSLGEADVARWGELVARRTGLFWIAEAGDEGAVFVAESGVAEDGMGGHEFYRVLGIAQPATAPLCNMGLPFPAKVSATLLPYRGRIFSCGIMCGEKGPGLPPEVAGPAKAAGLKEAVR